MTAVSPEKVLDLCVDVIATGFQIELQPNGESQNPASNPYYFKYWFSQTDENQGIEGDAIILGVGKCRVIAWTEEPETIDVDFYAPTFISSGVKLQITGDGTISSGGQDDPWPET